MKLICKHCGAPLKVIYIGQSMREVGYTLSCDCWRVEQSFDVGLAPEPGVRHVALDDVMLSRVHIEHLTDDGIAADEAFWRGVDAACGIDRS